MSYFKKLNKKTEKKGDVSRNSSAPNFWVSFGNYCVNKVMSGSFNRGIGGGRLTQLAGPSGAGKSFVAGNIAKAAQGQDIGVVVIDSENALDDDFMSKIGIDIDNEYYEYFGLNSIKRCIETVSDFIREYKEIKEKNPSFPPFIIIIDSLDMLRTDTEEKNWDGGVIKGDMGQQAKQLKKMLTAFVHDIKNTDIAIVCTKQVYQEQDSIKAMRNPWVITESLKFAFSQILLVTKLQLKDKVTNKFEGIMLKAMGHKTRFTKPFQQCVIEVPYDTGMDKFNGLLNAAVAMGVVEQNGSWYSYNGTKFQRKKFSNYQDDVLESLIELDTQILNVDIDAEEDMDNEKQADKNKSRKTKGS